MSDAQTSASVVPEVAEPGWQRFHPLTPVLRGGVVLLAAGGYFLNQVAERVWAALGFVDPAQEVEDPGGVGVSEFVTSGGYALLVVLAIVLALALVAGGLWLTWRRSEFKVDTDQVEFRNGVLSRRVRQVPGERIQGVEISRPLLPRLFGLSAIVVQSAGGGDSNLRLAYLTRSRAEQIRNDLVAVANASDDEAAALDADSITDDVETLFAVPNSRMIAATLLHPATLYIVLAAVVAALLLATRFLEAADTAPSRVVAVLGGIGLTASFLVPTAFALGVARTRDLLRHGNFRVLQRRGGVRLEHGITETHAASVPRHRVQAIELEQPLWWRPLGWWRVRINVSGSGSNDPTEDDGNTTALPVGPLDDALEVARRLFSRVSADLLGEGAHGMGGEPGWVGPPRSARWFAPLSYRRSGYAADTHAVYVRGGWLGREVVVVPHARVQGIELVQGPLWRLAGLSGARLQSTPGPVDGFIRHVALSDAEAFYAAESARARVARMALAAAQPRPNRSD